MSTVVLLLAALAGEPSGADLEVRRAGDIEARLVVEVPEEGIAPGRARIQLELTFEGPEGLEVQPPRLEDADAGWRLAGQTSAWRQEKGHVTWSITLRLEQVKPGVVPLPGVVVGVRDNPGTAWQTVSWMQPLHEAREVPPPDTLPPLPPSPWPGRLRWLGLALAGVLALALLARAIRRRLRARAVQPAHVRALARLEAAELPPPDRAAERFAHVERVVRDYLDERFGLRARQQTTVQVLAGAGSVPAEAREALKELLEHGELVKFAGQVPTREECDRAIELARRVIQAGVAATVPVEETGKVAATG